MTFNYDLHIFTIKGTKTIKRNQPLDATTYEEAKKEAKKKEVEHMKENYDDYWVITPDETWTDMSKCEGHLNIHVKAKNGSKDFSFSLHCKIWNSHKNPYR